MQLDDQSSDYNSFLDENHRQQLQIQQIQMFKQICKQLKNGLKIYLKQKLTTVNNPREKYLITEFCNNMQCINLAKCLQFCVQHTYSPKDFVDNIRSSGEHVTSLQQFRVTSFVNQYISYGKLVLRFNNRFKLQDITQSDWEEVFQNIQNRTQWVHSVNTRFIVILSHDIEFKTVNQKNNEAKSPDDQKQQLSESQDGLNDQQKKDKREKQEQPLEQAQDQIEVAKKVNVFVAEYKEDIKNNIFAQLPSDCSYDILVCGAVVNESDLQRLLIRSLQLNVKGGAKLTLRHPSALKTLCGSKIRILNLSECSQLRNVILINGKLYSKDLKSLTRLEKFVCNNIDFVGEKSTLVETLIDMGVPLEYLSIIRCRHGLNVGTFSNDSLRRLGFSCCYEIISGQNNVLCNLYNKNTQANLLEPEIEVKQQPKDTVVQYDEKQLICGRPKQPWKLVLIMFIIPIFIAMKIRK